MALELAKHNAVYEDIASKFFEVRQVTQRLPTRGSFCSDSTSFSSQMP
jgi:hypothetical protein